MKYRMLSQEELSLLENDLKQFLIVNHVYGEEWAKINAENPAQALELVELFSDQVLQIVYEKVRFLENRTVDSCFVFHCLPDRLDLIAIQQKPGSTVDVDLSTPESIHRMLTRHADALAFFRHSKPYSGDREAEIHQLIEQGCVQSSADFWDALELSVQ
jgi:hypothetical protein